MSMRAYASGSGSVIFVPNELERMVKTVSYKELAGEKSEKKTFRLFGKRKKEPRRTRKAA